MMRPEVSFSFPSALADEGSTLAVSEEAVESSEPGAPVDQPRLAALLHRHYGSVWRAVRRFGVPSEAAEDATQEVFIIASRKLDTIEPGREKQFLHAVALRVAANARRARMVRPESAESPTIERSLAPLPNPEALLDRKQARELLDSVLDAMTEDLRTAFVLFELEGLSGERIAELQSVPINTVWARIYKARRKLVSSIERRHQVWRGR